MIQQLSLETDQLILKPLENRMPPEYWGQGYATELVKALIAWGFEHLSVKKLVGATFPDNIASQKYYRKRNSSIVA